MNDYDALMFDYLNLRERYDAASAEAASLKTLVESLRFLDTEQAELLDEQVAATEQAESALMLLGQILHCTGAPLSVSPTAKDVMAYLTQSRPYWQARIDAAIAADQQKTERHHES